MGIFKIFRKEKKVKPPTKQPVVEVKDRKEKQAFLKDKGEPAVVKSGKSVKEAPKKKVANKTTRDAYKILIRPLITEKATYMGAFNQYVFEVAPGAGKIEVKKAIESVYGVSPKSVNIVTLSGKQRRYGRVMGRTKNWKKAIITLKPGEKIEIYEGV